MDRLRKKEVEMGKGKEVVDKLTIQLQSVGEERDTLASHLEDIKLQYHDIRQHNERLQVRNPGPLSLSGSVSKLVCCVLGPDSARDRGVGQHDLHRLQGSERVLKRNLQLQMPGQCQTAVCADLLAVCRIVFRRARSAMCDADGAWGGVRGVPTRDAEG
eukprot:1079033-Rhodomonas_salina.1